MKQGVLLRLVSLSFAALVYFMDWDYSLFISFALIIFVLPLLWRFELSQTRQSSERQAERVYGPSWDTARQNARRRELGERGGLEGSGSEDDDGDEDPDQDGANVAEKDNDKDGAENDEHEHEHEHEPSGSSGTEASPLLRKRKSQKAD